MGANTLAPVRMPSHLADWQRRLTAEIRRRLPADRDTLWFFSSGTQSVNEIKLVGLSRRALERSARAVNTHLRASARDTWLLAIPECHVGGHGVVVRAALTGSRVIRWRGKWQAERFRAQAAGATLCSLVPTQVFDLVHAGVAAPASLRAVVVGGGALDEDLYARGRRLGWPLLPSYGLTETGSQVATASLQSLKARRYPALQALAHARLEMRGGRLWVWAESACHWVARLNTDGVFTLEDPRRDGWLKTEDIATARETGWRILGRADELVKVLGVLVALPQLEAELREHFRRRSLMGDLTVVARHAEREGHELLLVTDTAESLAAWSQALEEFNRAVPGPRRLKHLVWVARVPRSPLGKARRAEMFQVLC